MGSKTACRVRHRIDGLETQVLTRTATGDVRHRIDGLEREPNPNNLKDKVRHRIDGLENRAPVKTR